MISRDLGALASETFELVVVGGGITGAFVALQAARSGVKTALVERLDYGHATSARNSRLIHGGLRYLKQGQWGQVKTGLQEREFWLQAAPAFVRPLPFWMPVFSRSERWQLRAGLALYDWLAGESSLERARMVTNEELGQAFSWLEQRRFAGGVRYLDAQMESPERLLLEVIRCAQAAGAVTANYVAATGLHVDNNAVTGVACRDALTGERFDVRARRVFSATGPWVGAWMGGSDPQVQISSGVHLLTRRFSDEALAMSSESGHFFILPWRDFSLVGTTDRAFHGHADTFRKDSVGVEQVVDKVRSGLPELGFSNADVLASYVGLRALAASQGTATYTASRESVVQDHAGRGGPTGLYSAVGGKWTTSRALAKKALTAMALSAPEDESLSIAATPDDVKSGDDQMAYYRRLYGPSWPALRARMRAQPDLAAPLDAPVPLCIAEALHAVDQDGAQHLNDVVLRRTLAGRGHAIPESTLYALADAMGAQLGWSASQTEDEVRLARAERWEVVAEDVNTRGEFV